MEPNPHTGPEPTDPTQPEQAFRPVADLTDDELAEEATRARQTLEAIYPHTDRATSDRLAEVQREQRARSVREATANATWFLIATHRRPRRAAAEGETAHLRAAAAGDGCR
jgi:hypothetical protein